MSNTGDNTHSFQNVANQRRLFIDVFNGDIIFSGSQEDRWFILDH